MKRSLLIAAALSIGLAGCGVAQTRQCGMTRLDPGPAGTAVPAQLYAAPGPVTPSQIRAAQPPRAAGVPAQLIELTNVKPPYTIPPDRVVKLAYKDSSGATCCFIAGRNPDGAEATITAVVTTAPDMTISHGWAYVVVTRPPGSTSSTQPTSWGVGRTERVSGTAQGTRFIVQECNDGEKTHRVILLPPAPATAVIAAVKDVPNSEKPLSQPREYYTVKNAETELTLMNINAGDDVDQLVNYVESVSALTGID
jgi:hypothetical protein